MVMKHEVRSPEQALAYLTDCTLATVQDLAMKKSRAKGEYSRQISIAQQGVDWMVNFNVDPTGTRAEDIQDKTVAKWAAKYEA
jgi:hypothetical protein